MRSLRGMCGVKLNDIMPNAVICYAAVRIGRRCNDKDLVRNVETV